MTTTSPTVERLLVQTTDQRERAIREDSPARASYWDGYIGGLQQVVPTRTAIQ